MSVSIVAPPTLIDAPFNSPRSNSEESDPVVLRLAPAIKMTPDQFYDLCRQNEDLRLELTADGDVVVMSPSALEYSGYGVNIILQLGAWSFSGGGGRIFESSGGYRLPNKAVRAPDVSWISDERLSQVTAEHMRKYPPVAPDFVAEIISPSDSVKQTMEKMTEYVSNGVRLGIMLNPRNFSVSIYRPDNTPIVLSNPDKVSCEPELAGLILEMDKIWPRPR
ncbi:MAG: Uma2 family endonuclease [Gemmataceae bacterium]|nr:Uma2 family endonuclease [Gemmataceae bacterium]